MKNFIALGAAFLMSTAAVFAEDAKPAQTPNMLKFRQQVLEKFRKDMLELKVDMYLTGAVMSNADADYYTNAVGQQDDNALAVSMSEAAIALEKVITDLGGPTTEEAYPTDSQAAQDLIKDCSDTVSKVFMQP